nr:hypothetical protein [Tanacetum cinerariifolium]
KVAFLEVEKARLEAVEASHRQEVDLKRDRIEVVSKVVPYIVMELVHNDELGRLKATPFSALVSKPMSPPDDVSSAKLQSPPA